MDQAKIWEFFQNSAQTTDAFSKSEPRYEYLARQIKPGDQVLNIGVGRGGLEALLLEKGAVVSCLDPSENSIDFMRVTYQLGARAQVGWSQAIPFANTQFDVVVMSEVLEHLPSEILDATLREVGRVLNAEGRFIGTVPANESLSDNHAICPHCGEAFHRWGHVQSFSPGRLGALLQSHGFEVRRLQVRCFPDWHRAGLRNVIKSLIRYVLGRMGSSIAQPNIYFEAKKLQTKA
jgi:SAM-dependent methyltransferase